MTNRLLDYLISLITEENPKNIIDRLVLSTLQLLSMVYRSGLSLKNRSYTPNKIVQLPCTVISVGNIMAGGTGKTPVVEYLSQFLHNNGQKVCILTRGYKSKLDQTSQIGIVSDDKRVLLGSDIAGDEAFLLATNLPGTPVIVGRDRTVTGSIACTDFACDVIILDDGFQYRKLYRQIDIVVIDASNPFGNGHLIPRGLLREPPQSLLRADIIICTHTNQVATENVEQLKQELGKLNQNVPIFTAIHHPSALLDLGADDFSRQTVNMDKLSGQKVLAVSGIGNPKSFEKTLTSLGCQIAGHLRFPDHHYYDQDDIEQIIKTANSKGVTLIITTQKDAVKIPDPQIQTFTANGMGLYLLRVSLQLNQEEAFNKYIMNEVQQ